MSPSCVSQSLLWERKTEKNESNGIGTGPGITSRPPPHTPPSETAERCSGRTGWFSVRKFRPSVRERERERKLKRGAFHCCCYRCSRRAGVFRCRVVTMLLDFCPGRRTPPRSGPSSGSRAVHVTPTRIRKRNQVYRANPTSMKLAASGHSDKATSESFG